MIEPESSFWYFLSMSLIPGGHSLIQTERHSFQREYSQPCLLLVTIIFGVTSESGAITHTPLHVLTPVLCRAEEVSILLPSFGTMHTHNQSYHHMN